MGFLMNQEIKSNEIKKFRVSSLASTHLSHGDVIPKLRGLYNKFSYKILYKKTNKVPFDE